MSAPAIDTSRWPYVEISYLPSMTEADIAIYVDALKPLYERGIKDPCVMVIDTRSAPTERATLRARRLLVTALNTLQARYPSAMIAEAVILEGVTAASLYMAYTWLLQDKQVARRGFRDKAEASAWAYALLAQAKAKAGHVSDAGA